MQSHLEIGVVTGAHGLRGLLRVKLFATGTTSLVEAGRVRLQHADGSHSEHDVLHLEARAKGQLRMGLGGCRDRAAAEALKGATVWVRRGDLPALSEDEFYLVDTIGCRAETPAGEPLGEVVQIGDNGAQALLHLRQGDRVFNVPAVDAFIVDFDGTRLVLDLPDGLLEAVSERVAKEGAPQ